MGNYLCNMTPDQRRSRLKEICEDASYISLSKQLLDVYLQGGTPGGGGQGAPAPALSYQRVCLFQTQEHRRRHRLLEQGYPNAVTLLRSSYYRGELTPPIQMIPSAFREDCEFFMSPVKRLAILFERAATCEEGRAILDAPFYGGLDRVTNGGTSITVQLLTGKRLNLQFPGRSGQGALTTLDLKEAIQSREGFRPDQQRLIYNGRELQDHESIEERGIRDNALLQLVIRLRGGCCSCCLDSVIEPAPNSVGVPLTATVSVRFTCGSSSSNVSIGRQCICSNASGRNDQRTLEYANNNLVVSVAQQRRKTVKRYVLIRTNHSDDLHLSMVRYDRIELWGSFLVNRRLPTFLHEIVLRFLELDPSQWYSVGPQIHVAQKTLTLSDNDAAGAAFNRDTANVVFEVTPPGGEWAANTAYRVDISYKEGEGVDPVLPFNRTFSFVTAGANGEGQEELDRYQEHDAGGV
jgi:hypothetical protein